MLQVWPSVHLGSCVMTQRQLFSLPYHLAYCLMSNIQPPCLTVLSAPTSAGHTTLDQAPRIQAAIDPDLQDQTGALLHLCMSGVTGSCQLFSWDGDFFFRPRIHMVNGSWRPDRPLVTF